MNPSATQSLALAFGVGAVISLISGRLRMPAILPLLLAGIALGQSGLNVVESTSLGKGLGAFITLAIGVLIFEGGLQLDKGEFKRAPRAVWGMLTRGALVTWILTTILAHYVMGVSWQISLVLGAILIVTGPTVVQPILKRVRLTPNLHTVLSAEAILIDPIAVIATVSTLDIVLAYFGGSFGERPWESGFRYLRPLMGGLLMGVVIGVLARFVLGWLGRRQRPDTTQLNLLAIASCTLAIGLGEWSAPEAGLVAATICAVILAHAKAIGAREMRLFKEQISVILVGALFILLASRLDVQRLLTVGLSEVVFLAAIVLVVRPLSVAAGTFGSILTMRERIFAAFMAPRGIVAASVASISAAALMALAGGFGAPGRFVPIAGEVILREAQLLEQLVYQVIFVTVVLAAGFALPVAWLLGVNQGAPGGVLIIGAHALGRQFAAALKEKGIAVRLVDSNPQRVADAQAKGLTAIRGDATDLRWLEDQLTPDVGCVISWTGNDDVDKVICRWGVVQFGHDRAWRWQPSSAASLNEGLPTIGNMPLSDALSGIEDRALQVQLWKGDRNVPAFATLTRNRLQPVVPGQQKPKAVDTWFVGVGRV